MNLVFFYMFAIPTPLFLIYRFNKKEIRFVDKDRLYDLLLNYKDDCFVINRVLIDLKKSFREKKDFKVFVEKEYPNKYDFKKIIRVIENKM